MVVFGARPDAICAPDADSVPDWHPTYFPLACGDTVDDLGGVFDERVFPVPADHLCVKPFIPYPHFNVWAAGRRVPVHVFEPWVSIGHAMIVST